MRQLELPINCILLISLVIKFCCGEILTIDSEQIETFAEIYKDCRDYRKLNQRCYGWSSVDDHKCFKSSTCDYLVIVRVLSDSLDTFSPSESESPSISESPSYVDIGDEQLSINLYIFKSLSNFSYNFWLTNGQSKYLYQCQVECESDCDEPTQTPDLWRSEKRMKQLDVPGIDVPIFGCSWSVSQRNSEWPLNEENKPIDLVYSHYWLVLGSVFKLDENFDKQKSRDLPLYQWKYLYQGCDNGRKFCFGTDNCVESASCSELLIIKLREYDSLYHDYLFMVPMEKSSYTIDIRPSKRLLTFQDDKKTEMTNGQSISLASEQLLSIRSQCDQISCRHKIISPDNSLEKKIDDQLLAHSDNKVIGSTRKYIWSLPLEFDIDGQLTFNGRNTMYQVTIRSNNLTLIESKIPGLPGYSLREDIYKECETINLSNQQLASSSICFGLNKDNPKQECLKCSTCSMVAILRPLLTPITSNLTNHHGIDSEAIELQLFGNDDETSSIGLNFIYNNDDGSAFSYQCLTNKRQDQSQLVENKSGQKKIQFANEAYGSIYCRFIISENQGTWPIMRNGETINLINEKIPITINWNYYSKMVDPNGSLNPVHRFNYLYQSCKGEENILCIGFNDCINHRNCTNLVVIKYDGSGHYPRSLLTTSGKGKRTKLKSSGKKKDSEKDEDDSHGLLNWAVYSADDSDSLIVSFSGDNLYGDDYAIMCTPSGFSEHYIWETGKLKPIREKIILNSKRNQQLVPGSGGSGGFRCFWSMPGLFSVFFQNYRFDVITDTVYMNVTFQRDKKATQATRIFTTLPGFRGNSRPNSGFNCYLSLVNKILFILLLIINQIHTFPG